MVQVGKRSKKKPGYQNIIIDRLHQFSSWAQGPSYMKYGIAVIIPLHGQIKNIK